MNKYLFGSGGHAKVLMDIAKANQLEISGLFDDDRKLWSKQFYSSLIIGGKADIPPNSSFIVSIGSNKIRKKIAASLLELEHSFFKLIHPFSQISDSTEIEEGTVVMPGAILNADVKIGRHCIINTGANIDHDCTIEDFVHIAPGVNLCGGITVGESTLVGAGASIIPGIKIGKNCIVGAAAVVLKDVPDGTKIIGNPGRVV